jgi:DNA (cytosine-5)-methyltransferase 1
MARLHGFPDWFRLHATKWHGARQVGNSVPPPLARAIAGKIIVALGMEPERPVDVVRLGNTELVRLDMSQASAHFDIAVPIQNRNRKSGATKRKQHEIQEASGWAESCAG